MKLFRCILILFSAVIISGGSCLFYAFKIEPYRLKVREYDVTERKADKEPVKIVQFSDVHIKKDFTYKNLQKVVNTINEQDPSIVIFTGDLYDNYARYHEDENITALLQSIEADYAKIAIWGNRDYGGGAVRQYGIIMEQAGFTLLKNENKYVTVKNNKKIRLTGLDDSMLGHVSMPDSVNKYDSAYNILLSHEPDTIDKYRNYRYDLILSGHSHGGQINIPFLPGINKKAVAATSLSTKYVGGMYILDSDQNEKMYVNTGIGTTHISARFGVVPEITVFYAYL